MCANVDAMRASAVRQKVLPRALQLLTGRSSRQVNMPQPEYPNPGRRVTSWSCRTVVLVLADFHGTLFLYGTRRTNIGRCGIEFIERDGKKLGVAIGQTLSNQITSGYAATTSLEYSSHATSHNAPVTKYLYDMGMTTFPYMGMHWRLHCG